MLNKTLTLFLFTTFSHKPKFDITLIKSIVQLLAVYLIPRLTIFLHTMFLLQSLGVMAATYTYFFDDLCSFFERLRVNADLKEAKLLAKRSIDRIDELIAIGNNPPNEADDAAISVFNRIFGGPTGPPQIHVPAITTKTKGRPLLSQLNFSKLICFALS